MTTTLAGAPIPTPPAMIITGGCPVWPLPHTRACAETARSIVRTALAGLVPDRLDDCLVMASELATNAWLHGLGGRELDDRQAPIAGRSELAIYRRGPVDGAELVVTQSPSEDWVRAYLYGDNREVNDALAGPARTAA